MTGRWVGRSDPPSFSLHARIGKRKANLFSFHFLSFFAINSFLLLLVFLLHFLPLLTVALPLLHSFPLPLPAAATSVLFSHQHSAVICTGGSEKGKEGDPPSFSSFALSPKRWWKEGKGGWDDLIRARALWRGGGGGGRGRRAAQAMSI